MKITKRQIRRIIKEAIGDGFEEMKASLDPSSGPSDDWRARAKAISGTPTGKVEVEWDFFLDGDEEGWNDMSYEEQEAEAGLPPVIVIPPDVMTEFQADAAEYGESQAEDLITNWLSDETGWLNAGWSWVQ
jgi:hypothetical protein